MADQEHNGTEPATPRRREHARSEGQLAYSPDLTGSASLVAGCLILLWFGGSIGTRLQDGLRTWITDIPAEDWGMTHSTAVAHWMSGEVSTACSFLVLCLMGMGLAIGFMQAGFVISTKPLEIDFEKLLPSRGWSRLFSAESGVRGLLGAAKVVLLLTVSLSIVWTRRDQLTATNFQSLPQLATFAWNTALTICLSLSGVCLGLALIDYITRWLQLEKRLQMTREEIKQEHKDDSGDPHLRAALKRKQREAARRQSVQNVPNATVILTNPTHLAVALQFEMGKMPAPRVVAKGAGAFAKNIVRIAREHDIPVLERKPLARALYAAVDVGQEIPLEFFRAVAEIIAEIYQTKKAA
ncbi:MAG: EscU/YscU/HrcU family type III secretion system export apparatus switch protein [Planctomycetaceae bacterium]|nr:EscU/YscU/HrcU family type III secretion system export apparatus switch protein [Planctomycetaceae bacterium]